MNARNDKFAKSNLRNARIATRNARKGRGWLSRRSRHGEPISEEYPHVLSRHVIWEDDGEAYDVIIRVKVPASIANPHNPYRAKHFFRQLADYLAWHGVISTDYCQHEYDCCGHFYPCGSGEVLSKHGREIVIRQSFHCNI